MKNQMTLYKAELKLHSVKLYTVENCASSMFYFRFAYTSLPFAILLCI